MLLNEEMSHLFWWCRAKNAQIKWIVLWIILAGAFSLLKTRGNPSQTGRFPFCVIKIQNIVPKNNLECVGQWKGTSCPHGRCVTRSWQSRAVDQNSVMQTPGSSGLSLALTGSDPNMLVSRLHCDKCGQAYFRVLHTSSKMLHAPSYILLMTNESEKSGQNLHKHRKLYWI